MGEHLTESFGNAFRCKFQTIERVPASEYSTTIGGSGWSLFAHEGKLNYTYNWVGLKEYKLTADNPLPAGTVTVRFDFVYDGGGLGKGGTGSLFVNEEKVAEARIERTASVIFSPDETADVGMDEATNVTMDFKERDNHFTGRIFRVTVDVK